MTARLEIRHLSKTFGSTRALSDVELEVEPGEIHALVGQNGSGKSTLVKIVAGYHLPDRGAELRVDGRPLHFPVQPHDLRAAGIAVVHQDLGLVDHLSVVDNIGVGQYHRTRFGRVDKHRERAEAEQALSRLKVSLPLLAPVRSLAPADRFRVAIARALRNLHDGEGLVILDEATRALSKDSLASFYEMLRHAVGAGSSVLVVAHSLPEVMAYSDRVTVLRDGRLAGAGLCTGDLSEQEIARLMVGRDVATVGRPSAPPGSAGDAGIVVRGLDLGEGDVGEIAIARGEIVGVAGKPGSGVDELPYALTGAHRPAAGTLVVDGAAIDLASTDPRRALLAGVVLVPERRDVQGLALGLRVAENVTLPRVHLRGRRHFTGIDWQRREAAQVVETLGVRPSDPSMVAGKLSGGNQQKVLLGKWLVGGPKLLVLHEPTQGVDVAARQDLLAALTAAAAGGCSVVLASSDPSELSAVCHRVIVLVDGRIAGELLEPDADAVVDAVYADEPQMPEPEPRSVATP